MKLKELFNSMKIKFDKNSPEILVFAGVAGMVGATVLACRATIKAKAVKEDKIAQLDMIDTCEQDGKTIDENNKEVEYTPEDAKKDRRTVKVKAWLKYGKIFAPAVVLGAASISAILFGHNILKKRYISLGSAYTALDKAYSEYRKRVADKYGEDAERDIRYGYGSKDNPLEEGEEDKPIDPKECLKCSPNAQYFDETSDYWTDNAEQNKFFLLGQQNVWNEILHKKGYLSLNEVLLALDLRPTVAGQTLGWVFDKKHPDTFVDFGITSIPTPANRRFVNGYENVVLLDFNATHDVREAFEYGGK